MSSSLAVLPSFQATIGWLFLGAVGCTLLYGASVVQFYHYCERFWKTDGKILKSIVVCAMLFETAHIVMIVVPTYGYLVTDFDDVEALLVIKSDLPPVALLTAFSTAFAQALLLNRVYHLTNRNAIWTGVLTGLCVCQFAAVAVYYVHAKNVHFTLGLTSHSSKMREMVMNIVYLITDSSLAATLTLLLWKMRSGVKRTNSIVSMIMLYTVGTSLVTTGIAILALATNIVFPQSFVYVALDFIGGKCYMNCTFVSLNMRQAFREKLGPVVVSDNRPLPTRISTVASIVFAESGGTVISNTAVNRDDAEKQLARI